MATKEKTIMVTMMLLITYTLSLSLVSQAFPENQSSIKFSNTGSIAIQTTPGIGVYSNSDCSNDLTSLPWGTLSPGESNSITCYFKNEGDIATTLFLTVENWSCTGAETYLTVEWDYDGTSIEPNQTIPITLTLSVNQDIQGVESFSFDIIIIGQ